MTIVFINRYAYPDHSATSQLLTDLARALVARGLAVTVIASRQRYDDASADLAAVSQDQGVCYLRLRTTRFGRGSLFGRALDYLSFYAVLPWTLWRTLQRDDVLVAMTDPPLVALVAGPLARWRGARVVNWLQDLFPEVAQALGEPRLPRWFTALLRHLRDRGLRRAWMNVVIGTRMAELLQAHAVPANRVRVIANWAHEDAIVPMPTSASSLRARLGAEARFVVAYSGNLGRAHDADTLFAAAQMLQTTPGIMFLMIGGGHRMQLLRDRVEASALGNVHFLPYQPLEQLADALAAADLHLVSLRPELEGLIVPSKFYGIAAAARPIGFIGDRDGELARLIAAHDCGFSVAQGDGRGLADAILALATSPTRALEMGTHARQMLDTRFARDVAQREWHHLLTHPGASAPPAMDTTRT